MNNSQAQSLQRGGSSDQQAAGVPIITASNDRRNEEQQQQIVDEDSSHGEKELAGSIKNGVLLVCSFFAAFCMQALLSLPGDIKSEQLLAKPMKITVGQLQNLRSFLKCNVTCFFLSVATILLVTFASPLNYEYSIRLNAFMMGALLTAATILFHSVLVLATDDRLAHEAFYYGVWSFSGFMAIMYIFVINKKSRSFIRKEWSKIRDSCA